MKAANLDPFNLRSGVSKPYDLHFSGSSCTTSIGGNEFSTTDQGDGTEIIPLIIDGVPIIAFILTDGHLLLHLNVFNERNELTLRIADNALTYSTSPWDITLIGRELTIRQGAGRFLLVIRFETPNKITIDRGRFLLNGVEVIVTPAGVRIGKNGSSVSRSSAENYNCGFALGTHIHPGAAFAFPEINRY